MSKVISGLITVRTSSSRLPNKCLLPFGEGNVLEHIIRRAKHYGIDPIVCTSTDQSDDVIERISKNEGVKYFRGELINKLKRWSDCATFYRLNSFHTVDADDPFFDGEEMKRSIELLHSGSFDMVTPTAFSSSGGASVGYSLTTDIVRRTSEGIPKSTDTEMMWYHIEKMPNLKMHVLSDNNAPSLKVRLTLDYQEDYWLLESIRRILGNLASRESINRLLIENPDLYKINWFRNEEWKDGQLSKKI